MFPAGEVWDEFRWEEYLRREERKAERCLELYFRGGREIRMVISPPAWILGMLPGICAEEEEGMTDGCIEEPDRIVDVRSLAVYTMAREFSAAALRYVERLPEGARGSSSAVDFLACAGLAASRISRGSFLGLELDEPGGNIACCKRALASANGALTALREMHARGIAAVHAYSYLAGEATEVRDAIALYVAELREEYGLHAA